MIQKPLPFVLALTVALALACGGESSATKAPGDAAGAGAAAPKAAEPAAATATDMPLVGLKIDLPSGARAAEMMGMTMISGGGLGALSVKEVKEGEPKTIEAVKKDIEVYTPANIQEETLPDGFLVTFENTGSMGTNYWIKGVRTVGGKTISCDTNVHSTDQQSKAAAACKSIHP